ncbi:MAG: hypothetical protein UIH41_03920 [Treponemataceae bacterium]|nr:hypothetical protein [Treponemataceae bacterium]
MSKHPIRKLLGLTILYSAIIFGIFVIQFRNESIISKTFGLIRLILSETTNENNTPTLKNDFSVNVGGITVFSDYDNIAHVCNEEKTPLEIISLEETSPTSFNLVFKDDIKISFSYPSEEEQIPVSIKTSLPANVPGIAIPYKVNSSYTLTKQKNDTFLLSSKSDQYEFSVNNHDSDFLYFDQQNFLVQYDVFVKDKVFTFEDAKALVLSSEEAYKNSVNKVRGSVLYKDGVPESASEVAIVAYVAEMASQGKYQTAIESIPAAAKTVAKRTYLSAPYFNSLVEMNKTLVMQNENIAYRMNYSLEQGNPSVFEFDAFSMYIQTRSNAEAIKNLSLLTQDGTAEPTFLQASGIIKLYADLYPVSKQKADVLQIPAQKALGIIEKSCSIKDEIFSVTINDEEISALDYAKTGETLIRYGEIIGNQDICAVGRLMFNTGISKLNPADTESFATIYPFAAKNNMFYPHIEILEETSGAPIWAWTAAQSMEMTTDAAKTSTIALDFPQGDSHYVIINGITPFKSIEIYELSFRTDHRFETYNSSGYVFDSKTNTLFLKYRHKSGREIVKLFRNTN